MEVFTVPCDDHAVKVIWKRKLPSLTLFTEFYYNMNTPDIMAACGQLKSNAEQKGYI